MEWKTIEIEPGQPCGVVFYFPEQAHRECVLGEDYRIQLGHWDGKTWREQGTNHEPLIEAMSFEDESLRPTHWMPIPTPPQAQEE